MIGPLRPPTPPIVEAKVEFTAPCPACHSDCEWTATRDHRTNDMGGMADTFRHRINCCTPGDN